MDAALASIVGEAVGNGDDPGSDRQARRPGGIRGPGPRQWSDTEDGAAGIPSFLVRTPTANPLRCSPARPEASVSRPPEIPVRVLKSRAPDPERRP